MNKENNHFWILYIHDIFYGHSYKNSVVLNPTTLWIVGGYDPDFNHLNSSEFIKLDKPSTIGPELPFQISGHSMIKLSYNAIFIIGGFQNGFISKKTWIIDPSDGFNIREGPSLNTRRYGHSCAKMISNGKIVLMVAGGRDDSSYLDTVEMLKIDSNSAISKNWVFGKYSINI